MKDLLCRKRELVRARDWGEILSRYHASGMRIREFSEMEGIPYSTLRDHVVGRKKSGKDKEVSIPEYNSFIPVDLGVSGVEVELEFRDGTKLRIRG